MNHVLPIRVIVTENDDRGRSYIGSDGDATGTHVQPNRPTALTDIWHMSQVPTDPAADGSPSTDRPFTLSPQKEGVAFRIVQFDPMSPEEWDRLDSREVFASMNASDDHVGGELSPVMHRTSTVDFGIVLQGSITMVLDSGRIEVRAGDVIVQKATNHAWENHGTETAVIAFVLVDAETDAAAEQAADAAAAQA
jgi:mannose-6-phosphate isomerase-like protein (cupin superfamily)